MLFSTDPSGVFLYCWAGESATAAMFVAAVNKEEGFGSLLTVAICYGLAIGLAVTFTGPTSGAHLSPGITLSFAVFKGFPWRKVPHYIIAQLLGGFVAALLVYAQFSPELSKIGHVFDKAGMNKFTPTGPAGTIALFVPPGTDLRIVFVNELVVSATIATGIYCILDPTNLFVAPTTGPMLIGLMFIIAVACFGSNGIALNTARDLGARFAMGAIFGRGAFPAGYSALTALTNMLGTFIGATFQTMVLSDTVRPPTEASIAAHKSMKAHEEAHLSRQLTARSNGDATALGRILSGKPNGLPVHDEKASY